jgi:hypothetical protein
VRVGKRASAVTIAIAACAAIIAFVAGKPHGGAPPPTALSYEELTGSLFSPPTADFPAGVRARRLNVPVFDNSTSIWGSTGRDFRGHIWFGVSASSSGMSAHLMEYAPETDTWRDHGPVVAQLGSRRHGEGQIKIHSKIVPAADGWLYFASSDEEGERAEGGFLPRWGSHLWRIHPEHHTWRHVLAAPEGLIAVSGVGRYVYALGYWGHVLYQYDTVTAQNRRIEVGAVRGHVSRNFVADLRGHVYVPRLLERDGKAHAMLVEYDASLVELASTPLAYYLGTEAPAANHGIVGLAYLPDGRIAFTTHIGRLYVIHPQRAGPAQVTDVGWLHPAGPVYPPSLFALGGNDWVGGVARRGPNFEWVMADLRTGSSAARPLDTQGLKRVLLYGSISRDDAGRAYLGGWAAEDTGGQRPLVLQIEIPTR